MATQLFILQGGNSSSRRRPLEILGSSRRNQFIAASRPKLDVELERLRASGRQPFRYAPERPTTGKVRVARYPPGTPVYARRHHHRFGLICYLFSFDTNKTPRADARLPCESSSRPWKALDSEMCCHMLRRSSATSALLISPCWTSSKATSHLLAICRLSFLAPHWPWNSRKVVFRTTQRNLCFRNFGMQF